MWFFNLSCRIRDEAHIIEICSLCKQSVRGLWRAWSDRIEYIWVIHNNDDSDNMRIEWTLRCKYLVIISMHFNYVITESNGK